MEEFLLKLLSFETVESKQNELMNIIDFIDAFFNDYDVHTRRYEKNGKPSLIVTNSFTKKPKVFFNGHLDVVPGNYPKAFKPYKKDGKIYGRGSSDMKGPVVAMIFAFIDLIKEKHTPDIGLMLTTDEESGGFNGVDYLLNSENFSADCAFVPDTGKTNWEICVGEKGVWFFEVECKGKSSHASKPWEGINAINEIWKAYRDVRNEFIRIWGKCKDGNFWVPTINLAKLEGGGAFNVVPDFATARFDVRFPSEVGFETVRKIVLDIFEKRNVKIKKEPILSLGMYIDKNNYYLKQWVKTYEKAFGNKAQFYNAFGGSDARFFSAKKIPVVMCKPKCSDIHVVDEWCDLADLYKFRKLIVQWVNSL
jgi:succinyl-diaminopimelate desuccinylase